MTSEVNDPKTSKPSPQLNQQNTKQATNSTQTVKNNWKRLIWYAKKQWSDITEAELLKTGGEERSLTVLLKDRYTLKHDDALLQVRAFFARYANK